MDSRDRSTLLEMGRAPGWLAIRARRVLERDFLTLGSRATHKVASELGVSTSHLCKVYRRRFGSTIGADLRSLRIDTARTLLRERRQLTLQEVAARCGFRHATYRSFLNAFRAETGATPSEWLAEEGRRRAPAEGAR